MPFPVVTPSYFRELVDVTKPADEYSSFADVIISPAAVEYVLHLSNPDVVRKLTQIDDQIAFSMAYVGEKEEAELVEQGKAAVMAIPTLAYYWQIRALMMGVLQDKRVTVEKRLLLLNYALKTIQGMIDKHQPNFIPQFASDFIEKDEYDNILEYFKPVKMNFGYALADGISLLKSISKTTPAYKDTLARIYQNIGVSGPETLSLADMNKYLELRKSFATGFLTEHSNWIENILVNYVWTFSIPYAVCEKLSIWDNYVFFCSLYNAIKIMITCYQPKDSEEFIKIISAFDDALRKSGKDIIWKIVAAVRNAGQANNGDMAVLVLS